MERKKPKASPNQKKPEPETGEPLPLYDIILERFWTDLRQHQETTDRQIKESDRKFQLEMEERTRYIKDTDNRFQQSFDEKARQLQESGNRLYRKLEEKSPKFRDELEESEPVYSKNTGKAKGKSPSSKNIKVEKTNGLDITGQFSKLGYYFDDVSSGGRKILDERGNIKIEIGIILESPDYIMAIDKKAKPKKKDIDAFIDRLSILSEHRGKYNDRRKIYGAIMGKILAADEKETVLEAGFFAVEQNGNSIKISAPKSSPREL